MLIYQFTHIPTNRIYIGSKKDPAKFDDYVSSSKTVRTMMRANPAEWTREVLMTFEDWTFTQVVDLEQRLIRKIVANVGWEGVWNRSYRMSGNVFSPAAQEKRIANIKKSYLNPKTKKNVSNGVKAWLATAEGSLNRKLRNARINSDPIVRQKNRDSQIKRQAQYKEDISTHPQWQGYIIGTNIESGKKIIFNNMSEAKAAGFNKGCISNVLNGRVKQHNGYTWLRTKDKQ